MLADIAQERNIVQRIEPVGIVDHHGIGRAVTEAKKSFEHPPYARDVRRDIGIGQQLARFVLARWIADFRCAATHQHDRFVPRLL